MRLIHIALIIACLFAAAAQAQIPDYPSRPIRLVVPIGPGGGTDILARHVAQGLGERLRQAAIVENRPGAGSLIGTEFVAKAPPDGYTLLVGGIFNMVMNQALIKNLPYEPARDFVPLGYISAYPFNHVQAGRLRALAVSSAQRSPQLEAVPTVNETGLVAFEGESWFAVFAPAATPGAVVGKLRDALAEIIRDPEFVVRIEADGGRVLAVPPAEHRKFLQGEIERWSGLVARYGVSVD